MSTADGDEGGAGGKLRRKPPRRASATPYDRPPAGKILRGAGIETNLSLIEGGRRRGWISKLVDPASTLITRGAARIFSSVFRKRLGAPPPPEILVENSQSDEAVPDALVSNPGEINDAEDTPGLSEFERLLKQKTFTRGEYERLTELLRSRTVDLSNEDDKRPKIESLSLPAPQSHLNISEQELASPAEVAKAYMGSRPSKVSPSSLSLRSQILRENPTASPVYSAFTPKSTAPSLPSYLTTRFPALRAAPDNGYTTPASRGRSAIYRMSRSPYFRPPTAAPVKEEETADGDFAGPSHWTPKSLALSSNKQVLKRRSTVLESDIGSFGPIRRIRQKSNMLSAPVRGSLVTAEKMETLENGEKTEYVPVPAQSTEMAKKILEQLDKLVPSPKEKASEAKVIFRDEIPAKLTFDMLQGPASKTFTEKDLSKLFNTEANGPGPLIKSKPEWAGPSTDSIFKSPEPFKAKIVESAVETRGVESVTRKSAFKMQVPAEMLEFESDDVPRRDDSSKVGQSSEVKFAKKVTTNGPIVTEKDTGFTFQVSSAAMAENLLPPTPTMPSPPSLTAGPDAPPVFTFSTKTTPLTFSSTLASSTAASPEKRPFVSPAKTADKTQEPGFLFKPGPTAPSTTPLFGFSSSSTAQSNGLPPPSTASLFSFSSSPATTSSLFSSAAPSFQPSKETAPEPKPSKEPTPAAAADSSWKPSKESIFSLPASSSPATTTDLFSKPAKDSIFSPPASSIFAAKPSKDSVSGLPSSTTPATAGDFTSKPSKESTFSLPAFTGPTDSAPKPSKESIFNLPASTGPADSTPKPSKESIFGITGSTPKPSKESIFSLPPSTGPTDSTPKLPKESMFSIPASSPASTITDFVQKPAKESVFAAPDFTLKPVSGSIFSAPATTGSIFGLSSSAMISTPTFGSTGGSSLFGGTGALTAGSSSSIFGGSQPAPTPAPLFGSTFAATSAPAFSFTQAAAPPVASPSPFSFSSPFKAASPGNDQMSVEDSMADDVAVATPPAATSLSVFGSPAVAAPVFGGAAPAFSFGSPQPAFGNVPSPFQAGPGAELGNFSMGSGGGGDKSGRRFVKAKRDKHRKK